MIRGPFNNVEECLTRLLLLWHAKCKWPEIIAARLVGNTDLENLLLKAYEQSILADIGYYTSVREDWKHLVESKVE